MLKNVPILAFDQDQKIWSLDFSGREIDPEIKKSSIAPRPDKLARFLQDYWKSKKDSVYFMRDPNSSVTDKPEYVNQLKLQIHQKELINRNDKVQQDNLLSFLKEHMEKSINQKAKITSTNKSILMNLDE